MQITRKLSSRVGQTIGVLALSIAIITSGGLMAAPAGAVVNTTTSPLYQTYPTNVPGCKVTIGDAVSAYSVGAMDVTGCTTNHTIRSIVYLVASGTSPSSGFSVVAQSNDYSVYGNHSYNWTNGACGSGWWYTEGFVSIDGGGWVGPYYSIENIKKYGQC